MMAPVWVWQGGEPAPSTGLLRPVLTWLAGLSMATAAATGCAPKREVGPALSMEEFACLWERESLACVEEEEPR